MSACKLNRMAFLAVFSLFFVFGFFSAQANVKVGEVQLQKVIVSVKEGQRLKERLEKTFSARQAEITKEQSVLEKEQGKLELLDEKARKVEIPKFQQKADEFRKKALTYQKEAKELELSMLKTLTDKIKVIVDEISTEKKLDLTVEKNNSPIIYAKNSVDLTDEVIKNFDKKYN